MRRVLLMLLACLTLAANAGAHDDVVPYAENGKIVTGGYDDGAGEGAEYQRVFGVDLGETSPFEANDPGFNNESAAFYFLDEFGKSILLPFNADPPAASLSFSVLDLPAGNKLQYWDGTGSVSFGAPPVNTAIGLRRGANEVRVAENSTAGVVPIIGSTGTNGRLHVHVDSTLYQGSPISSAAAGGPDGIYLLSLQLTMANTSIAPSDPIYLLYLNNEGGSLGTALQAEALHEQADAWVEANLVPEPASSVIFVAAAIGFGALRRRVRRNSRG